MKTTSLGSDLISPVAHDSYRNEEGQNRYLLLPIETKSREFYSKLLFSCFAAERGYRCIFGPRPVIRGRQAELPSGVLIEKSMNVVDIPHLQTSVANGNRLTAWDEEGLIYFNQADYLERRVSVDALSMMERVFCWGQHQYDDLCAADGVDPSRLLITGNPRVDLLRSEFRNIFFNPKLNKKFGQYILINTKFGSVLPNDSYRNKYDSYIAYLKATGRCTSKRQEKLLERFIAHQKELLKYYLKLIDHLANRFSSHIIVIRPHPSENNEFWERETKKYKNVRVIYEGSANEWILSSGVMIHSNCTTGVEAYLMDKTSLSFLPTRSSSVESEIANELSLVTESIDVTSDIVDQKLNGNLQLAPDKAKVDVADYYITGLSGRFSSERILDSLRYVEFPENQLGITNQLFDKWYWHKRLFKARISTQNKRFPGISKAEVRKLIHSISRVSGRFTSVAFKQIFDDTYVVFNKEG